MAVIALILAVLMLPGPSSNADNLGRYSGSNSEYIGDSGSGSCGGSGYRSGSDSSNDSGNDNGSDTGSDTGSDSERDSGSDSGSGSGSDSGSYSYSGRALLSGTLKTMQRAACDDEMVSLSCPPGTLISIQIAQYGKVVPGGRPCIADANQQVEETEEICLWPNEMQYSLLQTVVEACQKKPKCKFSTKLKPGKADPCPLARKFVEVAYKCRPHEFRSRTGSEDDVIKLSCNPNSRVAIYDAQYCRSVPETISCPKPQGDSDESCSAPHAVETVMQICHGKRWCHIVANNRTFGPICRSAAKTYTKIVYACVPLGVLTERYEGTKENDEAMNTGDVNSEGGYFDKTDTGENWREPNAVSPIANPAFQAEVEINNPIRNKIHEMKITTYTSFRDNEKDSAPYTSNTKFLIYISLGISLIFMLLVIIIGVRCYKNRKRTTSSKNGDMFTTEAPNIFSDNISDLDNDVDVSQFSGTFYDPAHPDMILYKDGPNRATLRAMKPLSTVYPCVGTSMYGNVDFVPSHSRDTSFGKDTNPEIVMSPKSLGYTNNQFFYG